MTVRALIQQARDAGIKLRLIDGRVKAVGPRAAVDLMLEPLRQHRAELIDALSQPDPDPATWRELARAYMAHHWSCLTCIGAGQGYGLRCGVGTALWQRYGQASKSGATK